MMYKLMRIGVRRLSDSIDIPNNLNNRDWCKYQAWLAEGNEPQPMDVIDPWISIRQERNLILQSCDWTQGTDGRTRIGETKALEWDTYRQALCDLPQDFEKAEEVIWPKPPE